MHNSHRLNPNVSILFQKRVTGTNEGASAVTWPAEDRKGSKGSGHERSLGSSPAGLNVERANGAFSDICLNSSISDTVIKSNK